jgi:hypothetical protein
LLEYLKYLFERRRRRRSGIFLGFYLGFFYPANKENRFGK